MNIYTRFRGTSVLVLTSAAAIAFGCTKAPHVEEARTARATPHERQQLVEADRQVSAAQAELAHARDELRKAEQFKDVVEQERAAAENQLEAARRNVELVRGTEEQAMEKSYPEQRQGQPQAGQAAASGAMEARDAAQLQLDASRAKEDYATALVDLGEKRADAAEAKVAHAESLREIAKYDAAEHAGKAADLDRQEFTNAEVKAREDLEAKQLQVKQAEGRVKTAQDNWTKAKQAAEKSPVQSPTSGAPAPEEAGGGQR
jgi:hypothetical protein